METLQRTANRGSISTGPYQITNSCKFERDNSEAILTLNQAAGNQKTWTFSAWIKRSRLSFDWDNIFGAGTAIIILNAEDDVIVELYNGTTYKLITNRRFRDTAAWYHLVVMLDTTQGTAGNRVKIYINGVQETSLSTATYPPQDATFPLGGQGSSTNWLQLGRFYSGARHFSGYMAEVHYLNGTAKQASDFGEYDDDSGIWIPKQYTGGGYGTQGFYYKFDDSSNMGKDSSGEGHDANNLANITAANQATDTPTNNFCTFNALIPGAGTISEGATKFWNGVGNGWKAAVASMGAGTSGKWYAEFNFPTTAANNVLGQCPIDDPDLNRGEAGFAYYGSDTSLDESTGVYSNDGDRYVGGGAADYGTAYGTSDIMSIAIDMDNGKFYVAKNGTYFNSGDPTSGATGTGALDVRGATKAQSIGPAQYTTEAYMLCNYGGFTTISISSAASDENGYGTFEYAPPSGYYALCTKNLAQYG